MKLNPVLSPFPREHPYEHLLEEGQFPREDRLVARSDAKKASHPIVLGTELGDLLQKPVDISRVGLVAFRRMRVDHGSWRAGHLTR